MEGAWAEYALMMFKAVLFSLFLVNLRPF
jgi:hypothetical protein